MKIMRKKIRNGRKVNKAKDRKETQRGVGVMELENDPVCIYVSDVDM